MTEITVTQELKDRIAGLTPGAPIIVATPGQDAIIAALTAEVELLRGQSLQG